MAALPTLALVGKTNVGKSTLVNRITEGRTAFVSPTPHTTRDRIRANFLWRGREFQISDTAGFNLAPGHPLEKPTRASIERAIADADVVGLVVDGAAGVTDEDRRFAQELLRRRIPVILVVNKIDNMRTRSALDDAVYRLGFTDVVTVSAANGSGVGDLLDRFFSYIKDGVERAEEERATKIILVGQTNAGKSTLANMMLGSEEIVTSPTPHTTRDAQRHRLPNASMHLELIDTAGLSRKKQGGIEDLTQRESRRLLREAQVACLVLDATAEVTVEDRRIAMLINRANIGRMIVLNKMDLVEDHVERDKEIIRHLAEFHSMPRVWVSAKTGKNVSKLPGLFAEIAAQWSLMLPEEEILQMNRELASSEMWQNLKVERFEQVGTRPPRFCVRFRGRVVPPLAARERLANQLRERYNIIGTPIIIDAARR